MISILIQSCKYCPNFLKYLINNTTKKPLVRRAVAKSFVLIIKILLIPSPMSVSRLPCDDHHLQDDSPREEKAFQRPFELLLPIKVRHLCHDTELRGCP